MKKTMNVALAVALFCGAAMAGDGNQGSGGRQCDPNADPTCTPAPLANLDPSGGVTVDGILISIFTDVISILG